MANRNYPKNVAATTVIPFDNPITAIPQKTITAATTFTKNTTGAQVGYGAMIEVVADGTHVPDVSAFASIGTGTYDNTSGVVNLFTFFYTGSRYLVSINPVSGTGGGGGDTTPPGIVTVSVESAEPNKVLLAYGETLDSGSVPATSAYTVTVNGSSRTISSVAITGANVKVTFGGAAVISTDTIVLNYTVPGSNPIQDVAGNDAAALTAVTVGNNVAGGGVTWVDVDFTGAATEASTNKWTGTSGGDAYLSQALGNKSLASSADGALRAKRTADTNGCIFGFKETNAAGPYSEIKAGFTIVSDGSIYKVNSGSLALVANPGVVNVNDYVQVVRTGSAWKLQYSSDGSTWSDFAGGLGALTYAGTGTMYAAADLDNSGTPGYLVEPMGYNVT
jgi:hypothetical protein